MSGNIYIYIYTIYCSLLLHEIDELLVCRLWRGGRNPSSKCEIAYIEEDNRILPAYKG